MRAMDFNPKGKVLERKRVFLDFKSLALNIKSQSQRAQSTRFYIISRLWRITVSFFSAQKEIDFSPGVGRIGGGESWRQPDSSLNQNQ